MRKLTIEELKAENALRLLHPMTHPGTVRETPPDIIARGEGSWIWDVDGHRLIDGVGGLWCTNLGFGRKEIRDAIVAQLDELPFYNTFRGATHPRAIELSQRLVRLMDARRRRRRALQQRRLGRRRECPEARASVLEGARPARSHQVHLAAPGLSRRALRRRERQRQYAFSARLRAAAPGVLPRRHAMAVSQSVHAGSAKSSAGSAPSCSSARSSFRGRTR